MRRTSHIPILSYSILVVARYRHRRETIPEASPKAQTTRLKVFIATFKSDRSASGKPMAIGVRAPRPAGLARYIKDKIDGQEEDCCVPPSLHATTVALPILT